MMVDQGFHRTSAQSDRTDRLVARVEDHRRQAAGSARQFAAVAEADCITARPRPGQLNAVPQRRLPNNVAQASP